MKTKKEELFKIHDVKETPFNILEQNGKFTVVMANYKVTEEFETIEQAKLYINNKPWELLTAVIGIMIEKINETKTK